jgi:hypothetical protein
MACPLTATDLVEAHLRDLGARLRGPARERRDLLAEARAGLHDAVDAHRRAGADPVTAQRAALAEFGSPAELVPAYQEQLVAAQGRRTALLLAVAFPGLMLGWDVMWANGAGWAGPPSTAVRTIAGAQDVLSVVIGLVAALSLALLVRCARRRTDPRATVRLVGLLGAGGALVCAGSSVVMNVLPSADGSPAAAAVLWPVALPAYLASVLAVVLVLRSVTRTIRITARDRALT